MHLAPTARLRIKFYSFAVLAVIGVIAEAPVWSIVAPILVCAVIPLAVAAQGAGHVRALFLPTRGAAAAAPATRKDLQHARIQ